MYDCSNDYTDFYFDFSGGKTDERLYNLSNIHDFINSYLYGGFYMSTYPTVSDMIKYPFYLIVILILGVLYYFFLIFLILWRWFVMNPYKKYRKWRK